MHDANRKLQASDEATQEERLLRAFRAMPEAAQHMMLRVAESYEVEPVVLLVAG